MTTRNIGKVMMVMVAMFLLSFNAWATPYLPLPLGVDDPYVSTESGTKPSLIGYDTVPFSNNGLPTIAQSFTDIGVPMTQESLVKYSPSVDSGWVGTPITVIDDYTVKIDASGYQYMMVYYGNGNAGGQFFYDIGTSGGIYIFEKQALSHVVFGVSQVPAPAAVWLLGTGLAGLVGIRRKMKK